MAKRVKIQPSLIKSLIYSSENKLKVEGRLSMDEVTAASKLSLAYDSLRELLEALALSHSYKIYNHECYASFLKEMLKQGGMGLAFDELRKLRNAVNYYGKAISAEEAERAIKKIKELRVSIANLLETKQ